MVFSGRKNVSLTARGFAPLLINDKKSSIQTELNLKYEKKGSTF